MVTVAMLMYVSSSRHRSIIVADGTMQKICILQAAWLDTPVPKQRFHNVKNLECELSYPGCANAGSNRIASYRPEANPLRLAGNAAPRLQQSP